MLHVHRAERADALVDALAGLLADPPADPFAREVVAVPTRGMERWLSQRMSGRLGATPGRADGVCANVAFPSPGRLVGDAVATASGIDAATDPWLPERSVWPCSTSSTSARTNRGWRALATHLGATAGDVDPARRARRFAAVRHLADLFDRYARAPPEMVAPGPPATTRTGRRPPRPTSPGRPSCGGACATRIGVPSPAERLDRPCARLRDDPALLDLPRPPVAVRAHPPAGEHARTSSTRWPRPRRPPLPAPPLARAVGRAWSRPTADRPRAATTRPPTSRATRSSPPGDATPGRCSSSSTHGDDQRRRPPSASTRSGRHAAARGCRPTSAPTSAARAPRSPGRRTNGRCSTAGDRSVQVHACHGRARQVEVLRDAILHLLADDPTLEPRDVIVMCPDIETFAPLIQATFGAGEVAAEDEDDAARAARSARPARPPRRPVAAPDQPGARRRRAAARARHERA